MDSNYRDGLHWHFNGPAIDHWTDELKLENSTFAHPIFIAMLSNLAKVAKITFINFPSFYSIENGSRSAVII